MKRHLQLLMLLTAFLVPWATNAQTTVTIGTGNTTSRNVPINNYYNYSITEMLYTAEEIGTAGTISSISFYYNGAAKDFPITVYMQNVDASNLSTGISLATADQVFAGTYSVTATEGWHTITLDSPFAYDGTSNLLIGINKGYLYYYSTYPWHCTSTSSTMARYSGDDNSSYTTSTVPGSTSSVRPNIQIAITPGAGPSCQRPESLTVTSITTNTAYLNWTGGSGTFNVEYKLSSETNWTRAVSNVGWNYMLVNLTPATTYDVRVQSVCSDTVSAWRTASFTTACNAITTFPWSENFESYAAGNFSHPCWVNEHITGAGSQIFKVTTSTMGTNSTHQLQLPDMSNGTQTKLRLPVMTLPTTSNWLFSIDVYRNTSSYAQEGVRVYASTDGEIEGATELGFLHRNYTQTDGGVVTAESASGWYTYEFPIPFTGTCYIILRGESQYGSSTYMDNLMVKVAPTCFQPIAAVATNVLQTTATLNWTRDDRNATGETYSILDENGDPLTDPVAANISGTTYTLNGLTDNTSYIFLIQTNCANSSENVEPVEVTFTTLPLCPAPVLEATDINVVDAYNATVAWTGYPDNNTFTVSYRTAAYLDVPNAILNEGFGTSLPTGWENKTGLLSSIMGGSAFGTTTQWYFGTSNGVFDNHARINIYGSGRYGWLITPATSLGTGYALNFDLALTAYSGTGAASGTCDDDRFVILVSTDNEATWTILREWNNSGSADVYNTIATAGENVTIDLSSYAGQTVRIAFYGESTVTSNGDNNLHIDNLMVAPLIPAGAWTNVTNADNPTTLSSLTAETLYDVKVTGICSNGTNESATQQFTTPVACSAPTNLTVGTPAARTVSLSWTESGTATQWTVAYKAATATDFTEVNATTNPYTLTGLSPETAYTVKVRANCGGDDGNSAWTDEQTFTTDVACPAPILVSTGVTDITARNATVAWTGYEEHGSYVVMVGQPTIAMATTDFEDQVIPAFFTNDASHPWTVTAGGADGSGYCAIPGNQGVDGSTSDLIYEVTGPCTVSFKAKVSSENNWDYGRFLIDDVQQFEISGTQDWTEYSYPIGEGTHTLTWRYYKDGSGAAGSDLFYVDNISMPIPTVASWTEYTTSQQTYTLTGLAPETAYQVKVKGYCGTDGYSQASAPVAFTTDVACHAPTELTVDDIYAYGARASWNSSASLYNGRYRTAEYAPTLFFDNFENGLGQWTLYTEGETLADQTDGWFIASNMTSTYPSGTHSFISYSYDNSYGAISADNWLVSPQVPLGGTLKFWVTTAANYPDTFEVRLSTTGNDTASFTVTLRPMSVAPTGTSTDWTEVSIPLTGYTGNGYIAIHHVSRDAYILLIDDFGIYGETTPAGLWQSFTDTSSSHLFTGLQAETLYEVQVQADCGATDSLSEWSASAYFTTDTQAFCPAPVITVGEFQNRTASFSWTCPGDSVFVTLYNHNGQQVWGQFFGPNDTAVNNMYFPEAQYPFGYVYIYAVGICGDIADSNLSWAYDGFAVTCDTTDQCTVTYVLHGQNGWQGGVLDVYDTVSGATVSSLTLPADRDTHTTTYQLCTDRVYRVAFRDGTGAGQSSFSNVAFEIVGPFGNTYFSASNPDTGTLGYFTHSCTAEPECWPMPLVIGNENSTTSSYYYPVNNNYKYTLSETIIDQAEIGGAIPITGIRYYYNYATASTDKTNCTIYLQPTTKTAFSSSSDLEMLSDNAVMVYTGALNCSQGWNEFTFTTPYQYDGTGNLMVIVDDNSGDYNSSSYTFRTSACTGYKTLYWYSDNYNPDPTTSTFSGSKSYVQYRTLMALVTCDTATCHAPVVAEATTVGANNATVAWTNSNAAAYSVTLMSGTSVVSYNTTVDTTYTFTGLTANSDYSVEIRALCSATDSSTAITANFHTECDMLATLPYTYGFEGATTGGNTNPVFTLECWKRISNGSYYYPYASSSYYHTGTRSLYWYSYSTVSSSYGNQQVAILPGVGGDYVMSNLRLKFWAKASTATYRPVFYVGVMTDPTDFSTFDTVYTVNVNTDGNTDFAEYTAYLAGYTGTGRYVAIAAKRPAGTTWNTYMDDITLEVAPSCLPVTNLAIASTTTNSMTLTWADNFNDGATYTVANDQGAIATGLTGTSYTVTGLNQGTQYTFYVIANCSATENGDTIDVTGYTSCAILTAADLPYTEDFESYGSGSAYGINPCWTKGTNSSTAYPYPSSTAAAGSRSLYFYGNKPSSATGTRYYSYAALPQLDATLDASGMTVNFKARRYSSTSASYRSIICVGVMTDPTVATTFVPVDTINMTPLAASTVETYTVDLADYTGTGKYVAFYCPPVDTSVATAVTYNYIYIDDVMLYETPTCLPVSGLAASAVTSSSVTLTWADNDNTGATYSVYNGTTQVATGITGTTYTVTGLSAQTDYTFGVKAHCTATDASPMMTVTARTACAAFTAPYTWTFEEMTASAAPECWTKVGSGTANVTSSTSNAHNSTQYLRFSGSTSNLIVLPEMASAVNTLQMRLWTRPESTTTSSCGTFSVGYVTDASDASTFVALETYTYNSFSAYDEKTVVFASAPAGARMALRHNPTNTSWYWYVDDVTVEEIPSCEAPSIVDVTYAPYNNGEGDYAATVSWENTGALAYEVCWIEPSLTRTFSNGNDTVHAFVIHPDEASYVKVRAICGAGDTSAWSDSVRLYYGYCEPTPTSVDNQGVTSVAFGGMTNTTSHGGSTPRYVNNRNMVGTVQAGTTATVDITYATGYTYGTIIWVDWNKNYTFDGNEVVYAGTSAETNPTTLNASFVIPATQDTGDYVMRIVGADSYFDSYVGSIAAAAAANPCFTALYSVAEDYTLHVSPAAAILDSTVFVVSVNDTTMGTVLPNVGTMVYHWGDNVSFTAVPNTGYNFGYWLLSYGNLTDTLTANPVTGTIDSTDANQTYYLTAVFVPQPDSLTLVLAVNDATMGSTTPAPGTYRYGEGDVMTATAIPAAGYVFDYWVVNIAGMATDTNYNATITDTVLPAYVTLTINATAHFSVCPTVAFPFSENFEGGVMPACWSTDGPGNWTVGTGDYSTATGAHTGTYNAKITHGTTGNATKLITPVIDMTGVSAAELKFWHIQRSWTGDQDELTVYYRTSATGTWQTLASYTSAITTWTEEVIALPNLSSTYQIAFEMNDGYGYGVAIDDITIAQPPACAAVTALTATPAANSVTLTWSDANTGATYTVSDANGTIATGITDTFYTVTGLTANTDYTFFVTANCSATLSSEPVSVTTHTQCAAVAFPFSEGFESGALSACWSIDGPGTWIVGTGDYTLSTGAHTGTYNVKTNHGTTGNVTKLITPAIDMTGVSVAELRFWHLQRSWAGDQDELRVYYRTSTTDTWHQLAAYTDNITAYTEEIIPLTNLSSTFQVAFEFTDGYGYGLALDDISIDLPPSCMAVTALTATPTDSSVVLNWSDANTGATYTVYDMSDSTVIATGITATTYTVTGLTANTLYTFGVVANCSATDASQFTSVAVRTNCGTFTAPYTWTFEDMPVSTAPLCWTKVGDGTTNVMSSDSYAHNSTKYLRFSGSTSNLILLPEINGTLSDLQMRLWTRPESTSNSSCGTFSVGYVTDIADATTFVALATYSYNDFTDYDEKTVVFASAPAGARMALRHTPTSSSWYWYVDDVTVEEIPSCMPVTSVAVTGVTLNSVSLSWNSVAGAASYIVYNMADTSVVAATVTDTFYTVTGLTAETNYTFGVKSRCSATDVTPMFATVDAFTGYCQPNPTSVDGQGITSVAFGSLTNDAARPSGAGYRNYSNLSGMVATGSPVTVDIVYATGYSYGTIIWVDWNNSLTFDSNEVVYVGTSTEANPDTLSCTFNLPADQALGSYRMRILGADSYFDSYTGSIAAAAGANPCASYTWGVAEDYTLTLVAPTTCPIVDGVTVTGVTNNSVSLSWNSVTGATYTLYNGTNVVATGITDTVYTVTGLTANTDYTFGVVANCSATETSAYPATVSARTLCDNVNIPFVETFEATSATRNCWTLDAPSTANAISFEPFDGHTAMRFSSYATATDYNQYAYSPVFNTPSTGDSLHVRVRYATYGTSDSLWFGVRLANMSDFVWMPTAFTTAGQNDIAYLEANLPINTVQLAVHYYGNYSYYAWIDSVEVSVYTEIPPQVMVYDTTTATACDSYLWRGNTYTATTMVNDTVGDTIHVLDLTVNYSVTVADTASAIDSYLWHGNTYTVSGDYVDSLTTLVGCDSICTLHLTVSYSALVDIDSVTACDSYTWRGTTYTASTVANDTVHNASGADSVYILVLTVNYSVTVNDTVTACDSYLWHGTSYTADATAADTLTTVAGCDSICTLTLTVNHSTTGTDVLTGCDSILWNDIWYTASTIVYDSLETTEGCDSIVAVTLLVNQSVTTTETVTSCDSYEWNGTVYTASTLDTLVFAALNGCDSTVILDLTINYSSETIDTVSAIDNYTWRGTLYDRTGLYSDTLTGFNGCDSILTLDLTISGYSADVIDTLVACDSATWHGRTYYASTVDRDTIGADVYLLLLTINHSVYDTVTVVSRVPYEWHDSIYAESGVYNYYGQTLAGCDHVETLILTVDTNVDVYYSVAVVVANTEGLLNVGGAVTGTGSYLAGTEVTLTAIPDSGYLFDGWYTRAATGFGGELIASDSIYTFTLDSNVVLVAMFERIGSNSALLTVSVDSTLGYVLFNGDRQPFNVYRGTRGETVTLEAVGLYGNSVFMGWVNALGDTLSRDLVYDYVLDQSTSALTAVFVTNEGIETVDAANVTIFVRENGVVVRGAAEAEVYVFDVVGRMVGHVSAASDEQFIRLPQTGVYLVKVADLPAKRVVVRQ